MSSETNDNPPPPVACDDPLQAMLQQQARELDDIFHHLMAQQMGVSQSSINRLRVALRAQAQCQTTARTIKAWQQQTKEKS